MADVLDVFRFVAGPGTAGFDPISPLVLPPAPGSFDLGGLITDVVQRLPLPRLPLPRTPTTGRGPFPIPIPIPLPTGLFGGGLDCGDQACCKGFHVAKTKDPNSPSFGKCVRNRRMNALNPKALRRSTRRLSSFNRMAKNTQKELRKLCR